MSPKASSQQNLLVITRCPWQTGLGGEERVHLQLAAGLRDAGDAVFFVSSDQLLLAAAGEKNTRRLWLVTDITTRVTALFAPLIALLLLPQLAWQLWRLGRGRWRKAVLMLTLVEKIFATPLARALGYRVVWAHHAEVRGWLTRNPWLWLWRRHLQRSAVEIVTPSELAAADLRAATDMRGTLQVVRNPLAEQLCSTPLVASKNQRLCIGAIGRLSLDKDFELFVQLARRHPQQQFVLAGEGSDRARLTAMAPKNLKLLGFIADNELCSFYRSLDLVVTTSATETFGLVAIEASSQGVAVLARDRAGWRESVRAGVTGLLFSDTPDLDTKFIQLCDDARLRRRLGAAGQKFAAEFAPAKFVRTMRKLLFSTA